MALNLPKKFAFALCVFFALSLLRLHASIHKLEPIRGALSITSPDFVFGARMLSKSAQNNENYFPTLVINNIPPGTRSLAVKMVDLGDPRKPWIHWLAANIPPSYNKWTPETFPEEAIIGTNDFNRLRYDGPVPQPGIHRYSIHIFALDKILNLDPGFNARKLENAMWGHILARATLMGTYSKSL